MAFVSQTDRGLTKTVTNQSLIGPGAYLGNYAQNQIKLGYAPFSSTCTRKYIAPKAQIPGPGDYIINTRLGEPTMVTYSNKNSIIIKLNSTGTNPFLSKQPRFSNSLSPRPGPGQYRIQDEPIQNMRASLPLRKKKMIVQPPKNSPSISIPNTLFVNEKRTKTEEEIRKLKLEIRKQRSAVSSVWTRDKINRFKMRCNTQIGPGKYNIDHKQKPIQHRPSAGFTSKTVRSFFDTILFQTNCKDTLQYRMKKGYQSSQPAPGQYYNKQKMQNQAQKYKNGTFGSTIQRFSTKKHIIPGIPFYEVSQSAEKITSKKHPPFGSQVKRSLTVQNGSDQPGPGSYHIDYSRLGKILKIQFGAFGSHAKRQIYQEKEQDFVGPGYYQPFHCKTQQTKPSSVFHSSIPRQRSKEQNDQTFGTYDIYQDDISRKALQGRKYRQNLRKIECQKPPFDTQKPRFRHYQSQQQKKIPTAIAVRERQIAYIKTKHFKKDKEIECLRSQIPNNISTISKSRRFDDPKKAPGVGDYAIRNKWVKKSYNIKYNANKQ